MVENSRIVESEQNSNSRSVKHKSLMQGSPVVLVSYVATKRGGATVLKIYFAISLALTLD